MSWRKLNYLVPNPDCDTKGGAITEWRDARPQPTDEEIAAVSIADVEQREQEENEDNFRVDDGVRILAKAVWNHENRIRALEGKNPVTFRVFVRAVIADANQ